MKIQGTTFKYGDNVDTDVIIPARYLNTPDANELAMHCMEDATAESLQSCPTPCDPMDSSPPGSSVLGILQVRILEWVAMPSSRGYFQSRNQMY